MGLTEPMLFDRLAKKATDNFEKPQSPNLSVVVQI